jgi:polysaccharide export outer membrane protein
VRTLNMRLITPSWKKAAKVAVTAYGASLMVLGLILCIAGCAGPPQFQANTTTSNATDRAETPLKDRASITLREGDVIKIAFPGAPNLNTTTTIRRDGKITLTLVGEVTAAGLTPIELQNELVKLYSSQLIDKEVIVSVESSAFEVFVTGAVLRPGKIQSERPLTALEAIMEAGGFDYTRANLKAVNIIRNVGGHLEHHKINLKRVLSGEDSQTFYLKPSDIVYVPDRFTWF